MKKLLSLKLLHNVIYDKFKLVKYKNKIMNIRRIKHMLLRLSPEEKIVGGGTLLSIFGSFMPWYSIIMSFDKKSITQNAFEGDLGVIGFIVFILSIITLLVLIGEQLHLRIPQFGRSKEQLIFFLMGENASLILIVIAIYTKRSLEYTTAGLRFGIYLALIGAFLGAFAAFSQMQKLNKEKVQNFFDHNEENTTHKTYQESETNEVEKEYESTEEVNLFKKQGHNNNEISPSESIISKREELNLEQEDEYISEDEMIEEITEIPAISNEKATDIEKGSEEEKKEQQASYFTKEAGIQNNDADMEDPEGKSNKQSISMNFYED